MILGAIFLNIFLIFQLHCESESWGEDIEGTESDESSDYDSEDGYDDGFIVDSDVDMYPSPVRNSGGIFVVL